MFSSKSLFLTKEAEMIKPNIGSASLRKATFSQFRLNIDKDPLVLFGADACIIIFFQNGNKAQS